jgi:N-acyl homoserine lactone hydrolase
MKLHFLSAGRIRMRRSVYIPGADRSETFQAPVSSALIRHGQGNLLFDTGCHPSVVERGEERWGALMKVMTPIMRPEDMLLPSLADVGLRAEDIDVVVNSHFHPDHCGCNEFFKNATVIAHVKEIEAANAPGAETAGYLRADWDHGQPTEAIAGEKDVFGDGKVVLIPLPGHTPGTIGAMVNLDGGGAFLLASDAVSLRHNLDTDTAPRNTWNAGALVKSFAEVRLIERSNATVICGHDDAQWQTLKKGLDAYE